MWGKTNERGKYLEWAIEFTGNAELYGFYMRRVVREWKYSCEHNLSTGALNRRAWVGHAACALANDCPEDIVRQAWGHLTQEQRDAANSEADKAIKEWEDEQDRIGNKYLRGGFGEAQLDV
jgi:hypothetical protein